MQGSFPSHTPSAHVSDKREAPLRKLHGGSAGCRPAQHFTTPFPAPEYGYRRSGKGWESGLLSNKKSNSCKIT